MLTAEQRAAEAILQYGAQAGNADISAVTGVPVAALRRARRQLGIVNPTRRASTVAEDALIVALLTGGSTVAGVARVVGRSWAYVQRRALLAGVRGGAASARQVVPSPVEVQESDPRALRPLPPLPDISALGLAAEDLRAGRFLWGGCGD